MLVKNYKFFAHQIIKILWRKVLLCGIFLSNITIVLLKILNCVLHRIRKICKMNGKTGDGCLRTVFSIRLQIHEWWTLRATKLNQPQTDHFLRVRYVICLFHFSKVSWNLRSPGIKQWIDGLGLRNQQSGFEDEFKGQDVTGYIDIGRLSVVADEYIYQALTDTGFPFCAVHFRLWGVVEHHRIAMLRDRHIIRRSRASLVSKPHRNQNLRFSKSSANLHKPE